MGAGKYMLIFTYTLMSLMVFPVADIAFCVWEEANGCIKSIKVSGLTNTSFEVFHRYPDKTKGNLIFCDWLTDRYEFQCGSFNCSHMTGTVEASLVSFDICEKGHDLELGYGSNDGIQCRLTNRINEKDENGTTSSNTFSKDKEAFLGWTAAVILLQRFLL